LENNFKVFGNLKNRCLGTLSLGVKLTAHLRLVNAWSYTSTSQYVFMAWCLLKERIRLYYVVLSTAFCWYNLYFTWKPNWALLWKRLVL